MLEVRRVFNDHDPDLCWSYSFSPPDHDAWRALHIFSGTPYTFRVNDLARKQRVTQLLGEPPTSVMPFTGNTLERSVLLSNAQHFVTDWNFQPEAFAVKGENQVYHRSIRGEVEYSPFLDWKDNGYSGFSSIELQMLEGSIRTVGVGQFVERPAPITSLSEVANLYTPVNSFYDVTSPYRISIPGMVQYSPEVEYMFSGNSYAVRWGYYEINQNNWAHNFYVCMLSTVFRKIGSIEQIGVPVPINNIYSATAHYNYCSTGFFFPGTPNEAYAGRPKALYDSRALSFAEGNLGWGGYTTLQPTFTFRPSERDDLETQLIGHADGKFYSYSPQDLTFKRFGHVVSDLAPDILSMAGYALPDVLDQSIQSFGMNQFENVEGVSSLFGLCDVRELFRRAVSVARGEGHNNLLRTMLDLLADARLVYSYALSPTKNDVKSIVGGARAFRHRWLNGGTFDTTPLRGKTNFDIPTSCSGGFALRLATSTKVVGKFNPDNFLPALLPLDAIGVLPRFSNLWATYPFSFVFDNILNVSEGLLLAETMATLPMIYEAEYTVFSATVDTDRLMSTDPLIYNMAGSFSGSVQYRAFHRWVLPRLPFVVPSRIAEPLLASRMPSDWTTYGALAYRVLL